MSSAAALSTSNDTVFIIAVVAFFMGPFLAFVALLAAGRVVLLPGKDGGAGRRLLGPLLITYYYWLLTPLFRFAASSGVRPNQVTLGALAIACGTAVAIATGYFALASVFLIAGSTLDIVDGQLARSKRMSTRGGAFLDSTIDRICDGLIFGACVVYYAGTLMIYVSLAALVLSFTVSYARARGEALGAQGAEGLMQRADRITILAIAFAFSPLLAHKVEGISSHPTYYLTVSALCIIVVLSTVTAVRRIRWTMNRLEYLSSQSLGLPGAPSWRVEMSEPVANDGRTLLKRESR